MIEKDFKAFFNFYLFICNLDLTVKLHKALKNHFEATMTKLCIHFQDYLGAIIVFIAVQMALISSYLLPDETSASLVGLALQYTLLIPIYLNWVVKLYADMEMYFGACERISYYIENCYHEQQNFVESCKYTILRFTISHNGGVRLIYCFEFVYFV